MSRSVVIRFALLAGLALGALLPATLGFGLGGALVNERASVDALGGDANAASSWSSVSDDGRFVAFASDASNLVAGDENIARDIFVQDRSTGVTEFVSVSSDGTQGNAISGGGTAGPPRLSTDGRYVVFSS
ncbi:MAG: PD40 domain-containing protein, partial [Chloroflexi bacterium]|nr:PD40 domain-containing protein [Chloroflexota bacterium]